MKLITTSSINIGLKLYGILLSLSIIIIILASTFFAVSYATSITTTNENKSVDDDDMSCFSSIILCLNHSYINMKEQQEDGEEQLITSVFEQVNSIKLKKLIDTLSSFHTRHTKSDHIEDVAFWIKKELQNICKGQVYFYNFSHSDQGKNYQLKNIICSIDSSSSYNNDNHSIIVSAHYDSRMEKLNNTKGRAPGADDNASGVAALLEIGRILSHIDLKNDIQFVLFSGEEQGQWGSRSYAQYLYNNSANIDLLLNLDMIGYQPPNSNESKKKVLIEYDKGNKISKNDVQSRIVADFIKEISLKYANLKPVLVNLTNSDFIPFEALGYTVIGFHDGGVKDNPNYHKSSDIADTIDVEYLTSITKLVLATILKMEIDKLNN